MVGRRRRGGGLTIRNLDPRPTSHQPTAPLTVRIYDIDRINNTLTALTAQSHLEQRLRSRVGTWCGEVEAEVEVEVEAGLRVGPKCVAV